MKIAVCSSLLGETPDAQLAYAKDMAENIDSHINYCNRHKYDYICPTSLEQVSARALTEPRRMFSWYKILLLQRLAQNYDYVLWLDADTRIQNMELSIETLVAKFMSDQHIALAGLSNLEWVHIQFGAIIVKKSKDTYKWLETIWNQVQFLNDACWEQTAVNYLERRFFEFSARLALLPAGWSFLQCFPTHNENPNSLVIHYAGKLRQHMYTANSKLMATHTSSEDTPDHHMMLDQCTDHTPSHQASE